MSNIIYGDAVSLHQDFLKFAAQSKETVEYDGVEYPVYHSQWASFSLQDLFTALVEDTEVHPNCESLFEFSSEAEDAIENSSLVTDSDVTRHYSNREVVPPREFGLVTTDYQNIFDGGERERERELFVGNSTAENRREAIAECISLYLASEAQMNAVISLDTGDDEKRRIDDSVDKDLVESIIREVALDGEGVAVFRRPDPSLKTIKELYTLHEEIGKEPSVRELYGWFCSHKPPVDLEIRSLIKSGNGAISKIKNEHEKEKESRRWASDSEPSLESLDSFESPVQ